MIPPSNPPPSDFTCSLKLLVRTISLRGNTTLTTLPFRIDEITSLLSTSPEKKYCDFCNENTTITFEIQNFSNKKFFACEDCGRKLKKILNMRDSVKDKNFAICDLSRYVEFLIKADIEGSYAVSPHES